MNELLPFVLAFQFSLGPEPSQQAAVQMKPLHIRPVQTESAGTVSAETRSGHTDPAEKAAAWIAPVPGVPREIHAAATDVVVPVDRWFAEDKLRHFFLSFAATTMAYGAVRTIGMDRAPAQITAAAVAGAAGLWKEWRDRRAGGPFSAKDLAWDTLGIGAGLALTTQTR